MTSPLPSSLTPPVAANASPVVAAAPAVSTVSTVSAVAPVFSVASVAQVAPILAAAQAALANTVNLSPQAQQAIKADAFAQLVTQLVQQIQGGSVQLPAQWPTGGVAPHWQALLQTLVQQASAGQPLPQRLLNVQSWPAALAQAVLQHAGQSVAAPVASLAPAVPATPLTTPLPTPAFIAPGSVASGPQAAAPAGPSSPPLLPTQAFSAPTPAASGPQAAGPVRPALPALQNWLVQQGVLQGPDGERAFTLTLRVPVAWAQAQSVLGQALVPQSGSAGAALPGLAGLSGLPPLSASSPPSALPGVALSLPFGGSVQQLVNATFGLVLAPQGLPAAQTQAMRTSAVLQLEFQPLPNAVTSATQQTVAATLLPVGMLPQEAYQALLARSSDPWLHMAQQQASGQLPRERQQHGSEGQCNHSGCQYQGRAECAQPFCAEMNSLWAASRSSRA